MISVKIKKFVSVIFVFIIECIKQSQSKYATSILNLGLDKFCKQGKFFFYLEFCNLSFPFDTTRSSIPSILHCSSGSFHQFYLFSSQTLSLINIYSKGRFAKKEVTEFYICTETLTKTVLHRPKKCKT